MAITQLGGWRAFHFRAPQATHLISERAPMTKSRFVPVNWKKEWGIQFQMLQNPAAGGYISGGADTSAANQEAGPTVTVARGKYRKTQHTPQMSVNRGRVGGVGAAVEVLAIASSQSYLWSLRHRLWRDIEGMSDKIAHAIGDYGGAAICGRAYSMDSPNPDLGVTQMFYHDTYLMDAGSDVGSVFPAAPDPFVGPPAVTIGPANNAVLSAPKFAPPGPMPARDHQHEAHFLVWAKSANA